MKYFKLLLGVALLAPAAGAQTIPHVSGTFKTPEGKTPTQAGLKAIATIGATPVYGTIDFQPYDSSGNRPTRILCGAVSYIPDNVRGWIKGDGTLVDNYTAAAGVDLVPTIGCTPAGLVIRATITLAPSPDGRIKSFTWTEDKQMPAQSSVDWGSLAAAGITAPTYTGYSTIQNAGASLPARNTLNFLSGACTDNSANGTTDCPSGGGGSFTAGGDLSGTSSSQTVIGIRGVTVSTTAPTNGQILIYDLATTRYIPGDPVVSQATASLLNAQVVGNVASAAADAGNPVKIGGTFNTTQPTVTTGQRVDAQMSARGEQLVAPGVSGFAVSVSNTPSVTISGTPTVTANAGTNLNTSLLALDTSVNGILLAQGSTTSGQKGVLHLGAVTTAAPSYTTAQTSPLSLTTAGALRVDGSGATQPVSGTVTANIGTTNGLALDATLTGGTAKVQGNVASAASDSGNPLKVGGIFNTTQPTVTTGQRVDFQATARGAQIVATGADAFAVNATQTGNWTARIVGNAGGILDAAGQNASSPANELLMAGQFNTTPTTITTGNVSPLQLDASGNLKVNIIAGGGTGGGPADVGLSTAASETDAARQKVTSALRLWDQAAGAGSQLVGWRGDTTSGAWVNCKSGCSGAADTVGSTGALNALNATASVALAGDGGAGLFLAAGTLVGTIVPEISSDNGTTWVASLFYDPAAQTTAASVVFGSANTATTRTILLAGGASHARVRVSAFTSGTANATLRATANAGSLVVNQGNAPWSVSGTVTANIGTSGSLALDASVTGLEVAQGSTTSGQKGIVGLGAVTTAAPTYTTAQSSPLSLTTAGALRVDGSGATQPVSGTVTANAGTGTFNIQANASVNVAQIAGTATLTGNGVTGAGSQRVTIASDNTAFTVNAAESGTWTVQPGNTANSTPWLVTDSADMTGTTPGTAPSKTAIVGAIFNSALPSPTTGQTLPLQADSSGRLIVNCGTGCSAASGVSFSTVTLFSATAATGTATSAAIALPTFSTFGTLNVTGSGITGSPSGCSMALAAQATTGTPNSAAYQTIAFTPGTSFQNFAAGSNLVPSADKVVATYACTVYPTAGTISATFSPLPAMALTNIGGASFAQGQRTTANSISFVPASDYSAPDTVGSGTALNALNAAATVATNAQQGAAVLFAPGTLTGTVVPEFSTDGGTSWSATLFQDASSGSVFASVGLGGPTTATQYTLLLPGGTSNARVRVSNFTSGSATASLRATFVATTPLAWAFDGFGKIKTSDYNVQSLLAQMLSVATRPGSNNANFLRGSFGRPVTSSGDALDVNVKYPGASPAPSASPSNALTPFHAAVTTAQVVKSGPGNLWAWMVYNPNASACFVDFFDTASPTLGTTVPRWTISVPATSGANVAPGQFAFANFSNAISVAAVTASGGASTCGSAVTASIGVF